MGCFVARSGRWLLLPNTSLGPFCAGSFFGDEQRLPPLNVPVERGGRVLQPCAALRALSLGQMVSYFATRDAFPICKTEVVLLQSYKA